MNSHLFDERGQEVDASFNLEAESTGYSLVMESRGGTKGTSKAKNTQYAQGLSLLLLRLAQLDGSIHDALLETARTATLSPEDRRLRLDGFNYPIQLRGIDVEDLRLELARAQGRTGRSDSDAKGFGNGTKRIRLYFTLPHSLERSALIAHLTSSDRREETIFPEESLRTPSFLEGAAKQVLVNRYERDRGARDACIAAHGVRCAVCDFSFESVYGELGRGFIHVHHIEPLATKTGPTLVDPVKDLRPVCPNCHAMLHRFSPTKTIEELKTLMVRPS
jgi:5-methylcytosine-specific restriction protein A